MRKNKIDFNSIVRKRTQEDKVAFEKRETLFKQLGIELFFDSKAGSNDYDNILPCNYASLGAYKTDKDKATTLILHNTPLPDDLYKKLLIAKKSIDEQKNKKN